VFSRDFTVLPPHPCVQSAIGIAIPAFAFPAIAGNYLSTHEGWKAELIWVAGYAVKQFTCALQCRNTTVIGVTELVTKDGTAFQTREAANVKKLGSELE